MGNSDVTCASILAQTLSLCSAMLASLLLGVLLLPSEVHSAAPDDIQLDQVAWYDASDLDGDGDYSDSPAGNTVVSRWDDKSGSNNHLFSSGSQRPLYLHSPVTQDRHGIKFDGVDDRLEDDDDIWSGTVDSSELFIVATTDLRQASSVFASRTTGTTRRLSVHLPWANGQTYFDHGPCCGSPARLNGTIGISISTHYIWSFIGSPSQQTILKDAQIELSDVSAGGYQTNANSNFAIGNVHSAGGNTPHNGKVFEAIFYQTTLNGAQRRILNSYLSAKWEKPLSLAATFGDIYAGDEGLSGDYDFFVGGIGRDTGSQIVGTSQGLTLSDDDFLDADGKFVLAGVNYFLSSAPMGTVTSEVPSNYLGRSARTWYIDTTGTGGTIDLSFDISALGLPSHQKYGLLHRVGASGQFSEVATANFSSGSVTFSHLPADGIYALGLLKDTIELTIDKTVDDSSPNVGQRVNFTLAVSNSGPDDASDVRVSDDLPAGFANPTFETLPLGATASISGNTLNWSGLSIPSGDSTSVTFSAVVTPP